MVHLKARLTAVAFIAAVCAVACGKQSDVTNDVEALAGGDGSAWWEGDGTSGGPNNGPGSQQGGPSEEKCDGLDNDLDGDADEDLGGENCTGPSGGAGVERCVAGKMVCQECTPGEKKTRTCGCGIDTDDVCNDSGRWVNGVCDGCDKLTTDSCGVNAVCRPGEERIRRCDMCPVGQDCGSSCIGATFRCTAGCEWEQVSACQVRPPVCDRDSKRVEECGLCGRHDVTCDGCFFVEGPCQDQGACEPGDSHATPCFSNACTDGFTAMARCNDQCSWIPGTCDGCAPGPPTDVHINCVDNAPQCGERIMRRQCIGQTTVNSCQDEPLIQGQYTQTTIKDECDDVEAPNTCTPNQVQTQTLQCGAGSCGRTRTLTSTCLGNGCGWTEVVSGSCGSCTSGQTQTRDCTTGTGGCGSETRSCTSGCDWGSWSTCTPRASECTPGEEQMRSCTAACNKPGTSLWRCAGGCGGWQQITQCQSNDVQCNPGDMEDLGACPLCPSVHRTRTCDAATCSWVSSTCPVCQ
ncbi:MAG: hypothetical protein ACAI38_21450 [Myxococcota bacterium]